MVDVILPLLILLALGAGVVYKNILQSVHMQALGDYVLKVSLPIFLFYNLATRNIYEIWQPAYIWWFSLVSLMVFGLALVICIFGFKLPKNHSAIFALGSSMSNTGFIGVGVLPLVLGQKAGVYLSLTLIIESALMFPLAIVVADLFDSQTHLKKALRQIAKIIIKNPIIVAIVLGMAVSVLGVSLPIALQNSLKLIGQSASPVALLVIGARLLHIKPSDFNTFNLTLSVLKVVVMPVLMLAVFLVAPNTSGEMIVSAFVLSALPMTVTYSLFAHNYGIGEKAVASLLTSMLFWVILSGGYLYLVRLFDLD